VRSAAILAGGKGTRLGGVTKALITVGGERLIDRQLAVLRPRFADVLVVGGDPLELGLPVVPDDGEGPISGIVAALAAARGDSVVVVACDMPHPIPAVFELLRDLAPGAEAVVPLVGQPQPLLARYGRACLERLRRHRAPSRALAELDVRWILEEELRSVDPDLRSLANINTADDLEAVAASLPGDDRV
jgi:molybdenum cofactor guanylyltransferase